MNMKRLFIILAAFAAAALPAAEKFDLQKKTEAAQKGDAEAQNEIGEYYADGGGGDFAPNYELAVMWWETAAKNGSTRRSQTSGRRSSAATGCSPTCRGP